MAAAQGGFLRRSSIESFSFLTLETGLGIALTSFAEEFIEFLLVIR